MEVLSSFQKAQGTKVKEVVGVEKMLIRGVARDNHVARIAIIGLPDRPGTVFQIFSRLGKAKINVDVILQSIGRDGTKDVSFTVDESNTENAVSILKEILPSLGGRSITHDSNIAKVSIVGAGMATNPGVAAKMFEALYQAGINIQMISTSEIKVSVLIERDEADRAVKIVHNAFHFGS